MSEQRFLIGIDVGGTFTDVVLFDNLERTMLVAKVPSDPKNQSTAFLNALTKVGARLTQTERLLHGTTVATNAILEGKGGRVGLLTTKGFRDIIEIGRGERSKLYDLKLIKLQPLIPRPDRFEVEERTHSDGSISKAVDNVALVTALKDVNQDSFESWAICFLHSYANPSNEKRAKRLLSKSVGDIPITISSGITPEYREYERFSTAVLNATVAPIMNKYLEAVEQALNTNGFKKPIMVMHSSGGIMTTRSARQIPAATILSGPAGGVAGAMAMASNIGMKNIITCDMGGTSTDVALVEGGGIKHTTEGRIAGYPTRIPQIDIVTVGAGGGSIAYLDGETVKVGPESAGANPGPACYGLGGKHPTVTDAALVLNRLSDAEPLSGEIALQPKLALAALDMLQKSVTDLDTIALAEGIINLAIVKMAGTIREVSIYRGHDPRDFVLVPYGGAGPMFASELASELGMNTVLVPLHPGNLSALGLLVSPLKRDYVQTMVRPLGAVDCSELKKAIRKIHDDCIRDFSSDGIQSQNIKFQNTIDARYIGQSSTLNLKIENDGLDPAELEIQFHKAHHLAFGHAASEEEVEMVNIRTSASVPVEPLDIVSNGEAQPMNQPFNRRFVYFLGRPFDCPIYYRKNLSIGAKLCGPLIVEEPGSTTVVWPMDKLYVDSMGNLKIEVGEKSSLLTQ